MLLLSDYDYNLPEELIAQLPSDKRENARMMVLDKQAKTIEHKHFYDIVDYIDDNCIRIRICCIFCTCGISGIS